MFKFPKDIVDITDKTGKLIGRKDNDKGISEYYDENGELYKKTYSDGKIEYYKDGKLHRDKDQPAVIRKETKEWYTKGIKEREETNRSIKFYNENGEYLYEEEKSDRGVKKTKLDDKLHSFNDQPTFIKDGITRYYKKGKLHRDNNQPAVIYTDGKTEYYKNGKLHRDNNQPAVIVDKFTQSFYKSGKLHRETGPAVITKIGDDFLIKWYHKGKIIDQKDIDIFCTENNISKDYTMWSDKDKNTFKTKFDFKTYAKEETVK